jgi:integrase/recombinase XerD
MKQDDRFFRHVRDFLLVYLPRHRCFSPHTVKAYREVMDLFRRFLQEEKAIVFSRITFEQMDHELIYEFLAWLQNKRNSTASTRNQRLAALKTFFHYCAMEEPTLMALYMDIQQVRSQKVAQHSVDYMSEPALKILLEQPDPTTLQGLRDRVLMILLYDTGARIQEMLDLRLKDLHLQDAAPCVYLTGKGNKTRVVPLMEKTIAHLQEYMKRFHPNGEQDQEQHLFYTLLKGRKGRMSDDNVSYFLKRYAKSAHELCPEVPLRMHAHLFRHTRAMHLYQAGIPLSYIKDFLGHVSINTTDIYASTDTSMMRAALEKIQHRENEQVSQTLPVWQDNEDLLLQLCGLK